jgi:hypothetical protein
MTSSRLIGINVKHRLNAAKALQKKNQIAIPSRHELLELVVIEPNGLVLIPRSLLRRSCIM